MVSTKLEDFAPVLCFAFCYGGYGVIYYHRGDSRTFSKIPKRTMNVALSLFITNIIMTNTKHAYEKYDTYLMSYKALTLYKDTIESICTICSLCSIIFPFMWYVVSFIYYFKTRNIINTLPPTSTVTEGINVNIRIMKAFKQSSLIIFISPTISGLTWITLYVRILIHAV